jgi:hypothetical protein
MTEREAEYLARWLAQIREGKAVLRRAKQLENAEVCQAEKLRYGRVDHSYRVERLK